MKVLFAAAECYPFLKTGGLGDVAYALPKALRKIGVDVRVIMPKYSDINYDFKSKMRHITHFDVWVGWRRQYCGIEYLEYDGVPFYFIDNEYYFKRPGAYGYYDDGERFAYFSRAILEAIYHLDFKPDILHLNDWHTSVSAVLLKHHYWHSDYHKNIKTVLTIHNLKFQGVFGREVLGDLLGLDDGYFVEDKMKYYDAVSFMKGGIIYSDKVTTVSPTYTEEVKTPFYGEGLHGLLAGISYKFTGILNGVDYDVYNPKTDDNIYVKYDIHSIENKKKNKLALQRELNLEVNENIPMIGIVSRLTDQKGFDLVANVIEEILRQDVQLVVLGTGQYVYEDLFKYYASIYPSKVSANICFNDSLARKIYAASDMFLMPSLFEPCGIGQLLALRYGSVPIVRETGGLKDTVMPYNEFTGEGWGFSFRNYNSHEMLNIIKYAVNVYRNNKNAWYHLIKHGMERDNSWNNSARLYKALYEGI
ncbi:glycogen synthase GlgA [Thermobrachium celere]|uniref:glycogen synthase GlgA n=1 Tax=Thermobrachium celere TaxID=53422 RepID=UPI001940F74E|nr:glycogen synthase GlgA [Thermobrachium celere]GFR35529.1 glycogen synthase [Thermobrachium celere]